MGNWRFLTWQYKIHMGRIISLISNGTKFILYIFICVCDFCLLFFLITISQKSQKKKGTERQLYSFCVEGLILNNFNYFFVLNNSFLLFKFSLIFFISFNMIDRQQNSLSNCAICPPIEIFLIRLMIAWFVSLLYFLKIWIFFG